MQIKIDGTDHEVLAWRYEGSRPKAAVVILADKTVIVTPSDALRCVIIMGMPGEQITLHPWPARPNNLVPAELYRCGGIDDKWTHYVRHTNGRVHPAIVEERPHSADEKAEIGADRDLRRKADMTDRDTQQQALHILEDMEDPEVLRAWQLYTGGTSGDGLSMKAAAGIDQ